MERPDFDEKTQRAETTVPAPMPDVQRLPSTEFREPIPDYDDEVDLRDYLEIILRRKWLVGTVVLVVFITTLIVSLALPPIFKGEARLEISPRGMKVTKFEDLAAVANQLQVREFMTTQVKLLQSRSLAERVIDKLNLLNHPVFNPKAADKAPEEDSVFRQWRHTIKEWFSFGKPSPENEALEQIQTEEGILKTFLANLQVKPERDTTIVNVAFSSTDPEVARDVTNALVQEFVSWQMDKKMQAAGAAKQQLEKQLEVARIRVEKAEEELNRFAQKAGIVSLDSRLNLVYRQLEEVNTALSVAESERVAAESLFQQAESTGAESLPAVMDNKVIQELRQQLAQATGQYEELKAIFMDEYPKVKVLKAKMEEIQRKIDTEQRRIVQALENSYQAALKKEKSLRRAAEEKKALALELNEKATQYKILSREVETSKQIFQSLLERSKEIDANVGAEISNIQVVDYASLPLQPYKPRVKLNLLLALIVGLMGGVGLAFFLEYLDNTVKRIDEISDRFGIPVLGVIPMAEAEEAKRLDWLAHESPRSNFSEAVRTAKVSIQLSQSADTALKSIVLTSTQPGEGKSTLVSNLALAFAVEEKVIIIDADMRRPRLHKTFSPNGKEQGLSQYLTGLCDAKAILHKTDVPNLFFIPSGPLPPNPAELLSSSRMRKLLEGLGKHFDRILIDAPPFAGFADVLVLGHQASGVILVSTVGQTHRDALRIFRKSLLNIRANLLGTLVNKLDVQHHYGYHYKYYKYYHYGYMYRYGDEHKALPKEG